MPTIYNAAFSQTYDTSQYDNPYLFTSRRVDSFDSDDLKLQYNRNRYYDYYTGRWLSQDPIGCVDGMNWYEYGNSSPHLNMDPQGLSIISSKWEEIKESVANEAKRRSTVCCFGYKRKGEWDFNSDYWTHCAQREVKNPYFMDPMTACKCEYPDGDDKKIIKRNFKLKGAKYGECCRCRIFYVTPIPQTDEEKIASAVTGGQTNHPTLHVICDEGAKQRRWVFDVHPCKEFMDGDGYFSVGQGYPMRRKREKPVKIESLGYVNCEIADSVYAELHSRVGSGDNNIYYHTILWNCTHTTPALVGEMLRLHFNKCGG